MREMKTVGITITITAVMVGALSFGEVQAADPGQEMRFDLADGTVISGRIDAKVITIRIATGNVLKIPVADVVKLSVGLNDRREFVDRVETLIKALDSDKTREDALRKLIAFGPSVTLIVKRHITSNISVRRDAVMQILKAYKTWHVDHPDASEMLARPIELRSKVQADINVFIGTITVKQFKITSPYGPVTVKLDAVCRIRPSVKVGPRKFGQCVVNLSDKTHLSGVMIGQPLRVQTRYGTMNVPPAQILEATFADDGKSVRVQCPNNDRITGTVDPKATISLKTAKGRAEISLRKITVVLCRGATLDLGHGLKMKLVRIEAGRFTMGSPDSEKDRRKNEGPQRQVTISKPFYMGATEVTQAQWKAVMNTQPWVGQGYAKAGANHAASYISWDDAMAFCAALSKRARCTVRLPTEAEWEYACRTGTTTVYSFGGDSSKLGDYAWYEDNAQSKGEEYAHHVGVNKPNVWGLYDMHGNVWEWCSDWYAESYATTDTRDPKGPAAGKYRVLRGGAWVDVPQVCRTAYRYRNTPVFRGSNNGFRVVVLSGVGAD